MTASIPEALAAELPTTTALAKVEDNPAVVPAPAAQTKTTIAAEPASESRHPESAGTVKNDVVKNDVVKNEAANIAATSVPAQNTSSAFTSAPGSAAAPAPAKEVTAPPAKENKIVESKIVGSKIVESKIAESKIVELKIFESEPANLPHDAAPIPTFHSVSTTGAPSFAALGEEDSGGSGGNEKNPDRSCGCSGSGRARLPRREAWQVQQSPSSAACKRAPGLDATHACSGAHVLPSGGDFDEHTRPDEFRNPKLSSQNGYRGAPRQAVGWRGQFYGDPDRRELRRKL